MKRIVTGILLSATLLLAASSKLDDKTGLIWQDNRQMQQEFSFEEAKKHCETLTVDGYTDWCLPTLKELATILDLKTDRPALKNGFNMRISERFWTATPNAANPKEAWVISFSYGEIESYPLRRDYNVRCVRNAKSKK